MIPKRSLKGAEISPALVVAPTKVKGGKSIFKFLLLPSLLITRSNSKSSMAGYKISSINFGIRWISSINKTSPGSKVDKTAAKSPLFSKEGPLAVFKFTPSSLAII